MAIRPDSSRELSEDDFELVELARQTIDAAVLARPGLGRHRQALLDYYPGVRVILPTKVGPRSVTIEDLVPLATGWSIEGGSETR